MQRGELTESLTLREIPIQGVDFLDADVAHKQRSITRAQASPGFKISQEAPHAVETDNPLQFGITDTLAEIRGVRREQIVEIDKGAVCGPSHVADVAYVRCQLTPVVGGEIKKHQFLLVW